MTVRHSFSMVSMHRSGATVATAALALAGGTMAPDERDSTDASESERRTRAERTASSAQ